MKAFTRCNLRLFKRQISRFLTLVLIIVVSVGFMSGVGEIDLKIDTAINEYYVEQNVADLYIKSTKMMGFSASDIAWVEENFGVQNVKRGFSYEYKEDDGVIRVYNTDYTKAVNTLELIEGVLPQDDDDILVERATSGLDSCKVGDIVTIMQKQYTVCGVVANPLIVNNAEEPSFIDEELNLSKVFYLNTSIPITNDLYVTISDRALFDGFSEEYKKEIEDIALMVESNISDATVLTLYQNLGLYVLGEYANKVGTIAIIFVVFFLLITLLVVYSTMNRLYDEERNQMACMKTLGYSNVAIISRYVCFVLLASIIGGVIALFVGNALTSVVYSAFNLQYRMPEYPLTSNHLYYIGSFAIILLSTTLLTLLSGLNISRTKPSVLLSPKMQKSGKKVLIERTFIWKKLSFRYKSTMRNVFLFKGRFFMTVISVIGSTVLVFAGLGLLNCASKMEGGSALISISMALLVFSAILCGLVVYNLTNINVGERRREIATLMVLGYNDREVSGYIFREIYIMGAIGALLGIVGGYFFIDFVFSLIDFGTLADIEWWSYILTPIVTIGFCFLATLLLRKKITNTDMNASLKSIE